MIVTYFGSQHIKITQGDITYSFNPPSKESTAAGHARYGADVVFQTIRHSDFSGGDALTLGNKTPFILKSAGEYEVKETFVQATAVPVVYDGKDVLNTIYAMDIDGIHIVFLGTVHDAKSINDKRETLGTPDIVFVSLGGKENRADEAYRLANSFDSRIIIPIDSNSESLGTFIKESGKVVADSIEKVTLKKRDLEGKVGEIIILSPEK